MANDFVPAQNTPASTSPNVSYVRPELTEMFDQYELIEDVLAGSKQVKRKGPLYLPMPNAEDTSAENKSRYAAYKLRAQFYNFTKRTLQGLVGQIFMRDAVVELPTIMQILVPDATGSGVTLEQLATSLAYKVTSKGRAFIFTDFPDADEPATAAQITSGVVRPSILLYDARDVINWRTVVVKGRELLSLIVIHELSMLEDDGFEKSMREQWRVLRLVNGIYNVTIYTRDDTGFTQLESYEPKDGQGNNLTEIPGTFVGALNNDANIDEPPMYDLADLNIGHYRNSADYEESCFLVGQPTPVITGVDQQWVETVLKKKIVLGSRGSVPLPVSADMKLVQSQPNSQPFEAMGHKERQAVALGAKLVEQKSVQRTLGEAELENSAESSVLANIGKNVELAINVGLKWAGVFLDETGTFTYSLNTEFDLTQMDAAERAQLLAEWEAGEIVTEEMRASLRRGGIAYLSDDEYKNALAVDEKARQQKAADAMKLQQEMPNQNSNSGGQPDNAPPTA